MRNQATSCLVALAVICSVLSVEARFSWKRKYGALGLPRLDQHSRHLLGDSSNESHWLDQKLDHFNPQNVQTWKQRYFSRADKWRPTGPVFLMMGGEGVASPVWLKKGQIAEALADRFGAYLIHLEHRFYGQSFPTPNMELENLQYLSSEQALADAAYFIQQYQISHPELAQVPWISFGGSYSGSMAAWLRLKYPHLVTGAVASSGPLVAQVDFEQFQEVVAQSVGKQCSDTFATAIKQIQRLLDHPLGVRMLNKEFALCSVLDSSDKQNVISFLASLVDVVDGVVQYSKDNRHFEGADPIDIDQMCGVMLNTTTTEFKRFAQVVKLVLDTQDESCLDYDYDEMIAQLQNTTFGDDSDAGRQWTYQTCTEFGFFPTTNSQAEPFYNLLPADFYSKQCVEVFGPEFTVDYLNNAVVETNINYGALSIEADRVMFVYGSVDPWHALGARNYTYESSKSIFIEGTAHCADLYPTANSDVATLTEARQQISDYIDFLVSSHNQHVKRN